MIRSFRGLQQTIKHRELTSREALSDELDEFARDIYESDRTVRELTNTQTWFDTEVLGNTRRTSSRAGERHSAMSPMSPNGGGGGRESRRDSVEAAAVPVVQSSPVVLSGTRDKSNRVNPQGGSNLVGPLTNDDVVPAIALGKGAYGSTDARPVKRPVGIRPPADGAPIDTGTAHPATFV